MTKYYCNNCTNADSIVPSADCCPACQTALPAPNVRAADTDAEIKALDLRVAAAEAETAARGCVDKLEDFGNVVEAQASAVIGRPLTEVLRLIKENQLYNTYYGQVDGGSRLPEDNIFDEERVVADGFLFHNYAKKIVFAALTLNDFGPKSYGPYSLVLKEEAIAHRATTFESNSLTFCKAHNISLNNKIPAGYRAAWKKKGLLAKAKLHSFITSATTKDEYPNILLQNNGGTEKDEFIEVHIYNGFSRGALKAVSFGETKKAADAVIIKSLKKILKDLNVNVIDLNSLKKAA